MLYEKNENQTLSDDLFRDPTSEYRGAPFWSWTDELDPEECVRQAHIFEEMGFGGYHMHPRVGLVTPYLGDRFNECVKACVEDAKKKGMLAWLYDEDRYPSGFAGGAVTKDGRFRRRGLLFTATKRKEDATYSQGRQTGGAKLLATYAVRLLCGKCLGYKRLAAGEKAFGKRFYAYLVVDEPSDGFNQAGYVDAMCKDALDAFADYTYGTYQKVVGDEFGKTIPAIFTDEPQIKFLKPFKSSWLPLKATIPWTDDFEETYRAAFGAEVLDTLPELFFDMNSPTVARSRYAYHTHRTERFAEAFSDNLGERAAALGLALTGHLMEEPSLKTQCYAVGETMRHYKHFGIPGIDMLCGRHEYTTAKQTQSVVRQEGKEGMLCELYGVSRWVAEFGKFKEEGDWLACLGVTVRVPHLSFYSMRGEAKRDYPPSIFYQAPWYLKFKQVEDHFARLNTALSRGRAINEVAVIHPIESYFVSLGAVNTSRKICETLDKNFLSLTDWLLFDGCDFDFLSEALLPSQRRKDPLAVGECKYKTILVPGLLTMRRSTLDFLTAFRAAGGKVVFLGKIPSLVEGVPSDEVRDFAEGCTRLPFEKQAILSSVKENLAVTLYSEKKPEGYLFTLREDGEDRWLFVTSPRQGFPYPRSVTVTNERPALKDRVRVGIKGVWSLKEYDTLTGEIRELPSVVDHGVTYVDKTLYNNDSLLLRCEKRAPGALEGRSRHEYEPYHSITGFGAVPYRLHEPNVLFLDKGEWSVGKGYHGRCDLDIATAKVRKALGLPKYRNSLQPWIYGSKGEKMKVSLRFVFQSEVACPAKFACEYEEFTLVVNGKEITAPTDGYYVDRVIRTTPIEIEKGRNVIELSLPFGGNDCLENCYLLGAFGVELSGTKGRLVPLPETICFRDLTKQKMPFYSGKISYYIGLGTSGQNAQSSVDYASALLTVGLNGEEYDILYAPYTAEFPTKEGINSIELVAYVPRENVFGTVHIRRKYKRSNSPSWYHKTSLPWRVRRYVLEPGGILDDPVITLEKEVRSK